MSTSAVSGNPARVPSPSTAERIATPQREWPPPSDWLFDARRLMLLAQHLGLPTWRWRARGQPVDGLRALVDVTRALLGARAVALFDLRGKCPCLRASDGLTRVGLDMLRMTEPSRPAKRVNVESFRRGMARGLIVWCRDVSGLAGLLYVEHDRACEEPWLSFVSSLGERLARLLRVPAPHVAGTRGPTGEPQAERRARAAGPWGAAGLMALMEEYEWNISRVARALNLTRQAIYNRLARAGVKRRRVPKSD